MEFQQFATKIDQRPMNSPTSPLPAPTYNIESSLLRPRRPVITHILVFSGEIQGNETIIEQ